MFGKVSGRTRKRLEEHGIHATATVLEIAERGMAVTHGSEAVVSDTELAVKLRLHVQPEGRAAYEVQTRMRFPQLAVPSQGQTLALIVDPDDPESLMLDGTPSGQVNAMLAGLQGQGLRQDQIDSIAAAQQLAVAGADPQDIVRRVNEIRAAAGQPPAQVLGAGAAEPGADPVELLAKLADLRDRGVLTESEFQAQKARILSNG